MSTLKWLGPGYFGKDVAPGDDMPEIDKKRLNKFIKAGKVGTIAEKVDIKKLNSEEITSLKKENAGLKKQFAPLEKRCSVLEKSLSVSEGQNVDFDKEIEEFGKKIKEISDLNVDIAIKYEASEKENASLKKQVSDFEKEIADLVKVAKKKDK